jgi:KTSC domain
MAIDLKPVTSSNIAAVGHEGDTLYVKFKSGPTWKYTPVNAATYDEMLAAHSIGGYFARHIKPTCHAERQESIA